MRLEKLPQVDLNLLITFAAIAEEKSIIAAASRLLLSQPAVSRALQRARAMFREFRIGLLSSAGNLFPSSCFRAQFPDPARGGKSMRSTGSV
jgi:Bacterial regulatory helix-turn-helix protein, lysR family